MVDADGKLIFGGGETFDDGISNNEGFPRGISDSHSVGSENVSTERETFPTEGDIFPMAMDKSRDVAFCSLPSHSAILTHIYSERGIPQTEPQLLPMETATLAVRQAIMNSTTSPRTGYRL
ncbi:Hypothetical protein NTJ_06706 [Nesidiocoris tenuis]|uniref:Uncharacterized protein n=1 Tax=Nesidiocoris tenuis TaxID=355587 RepID=A0ABN7ANU2_9HEMI|nr:Hypothetical protein NTJ_06706 [Nesidiocoris tenuis]